MNSRIQGGLLPLTLAGRPWSDEWTTGTRPQTPNIADGCPRSSFPSVVRSQWPLARSRWPRSSHLLGGVESVEAHRHRLALQHLDHIGLGLGLVLLHRLDDLVMAVFQHPVDQTRQFVGGRFIRSKCADPTANPAVEQSQRSHRLAHQPCGQPQGGGHWLVFLRRRRRFFVLLLSSCGGQSRSQLEKCFSVGKQLTSTPISPKTTRAVPTSIPSINVGPRPMA